MWFLKTLGLSALCACSLAPDEVSLTVGQTFAGDSSLEGWPIDNEDSQHVFFGGTWYVGPPRLVQLAPSPMEIAMDNLTEAAMAFEDAQDAVLEADAPSATGIADDVVKVITAMDVVSRVLAVAGVFFALWVFRRPIIRMFPFGGGNGNGGKKG